MEKHNRWDAEGGENGRGIWLRGARECLCFTVFYRRRQWIGLRSTMGRIRKPYPGFRVLFSNQIKAVAAPVTTLGFDQTRSLKMRNMRLK